MTNALAQSSENITSTADILLNLKNGNLASRNVEKDDSFSNLVNTLDANTKKVQTNFIKKAAKTNTSSINQLALNNNNKKTTENKQQAPKEVDDKNLSTNNIDNTKNIENSTQIQNTTDEKDIKKKNETIKEDNSDKKTEDNISSKNTETNDTKEIKDINNSSPVEPSPVFSCDETTQDIKLDEQDKEDIKNIINDILISFGIDTTQNKDLNTEIDESLSKIDTLNEVSGAIEEVFASLDNLNLSEDNKNNLSQTFEQIKNIINNSNKNIKNDINLEAQAKEFLNNLTSKVAKVNENDLSEITLSNDINLENTTTQDETKLNTDNNTDEFTQAIENTIKEIKNALNEKDFDKINQSLEELNNLISEEDNSKIDIDKNLIENVENLETEISTLLKSFDNDNQNAINLTEINENIDNLLNKLETEVSKEAQNLDNETLIETNDIKISENTKEENPLKEILEAFDDFKNSSDYEKLSNEDKEKFNEYVDKITNSLEQNAINSNEIQNTLKADKTNVQETIKEINDFINNNLDNVENDETKPTLNENNLNNIQKETKNTIDLSEVFSQNKNSSNNESFLNQNSNSNLSYDDSFVEPNQTIEADFNTKDVEITQENIEENEINLQKETFVNALQDEMLLDIDFQPEAESGALSVADEVAKMALNQQNSSLNTVSAVHGTISYDNLAPELSMIKNAAQMMKIQNTQSQTQNNIGNDIFNQITNKITQLQDSQGQKLTMVLRPHDLGRLSIELTTNQLGLTTNIIAQNDDVRAYIEKNIDSLRQQLSDAGVNVNNIQIKTMGQEGSTNYQGNNQNFDSNQQQNQDTNNQNQQRQNQQQQKDNRELLANMSNYDLHFAKDFSSILNKTINYSL